ncbi:MAG TPA: ABC transporter permease [Acidobacteriota bacterium]|nr:ABC transporter permease [Acidobacteriota bacterium]
MRNIFHIAKREFLATVATRAFVIGLLIVPAMFALLAMLIPRLFNMRNIKIQGEILVVDPTGQVMPELQKAFDPVRMEVRRKEEAQKALLQASQQVRRFGGREAAGSLEDMIGSVPHFRILPRPPETDVEREKDWLYTQPKEMPHLALAVIHPNAVMPAGGGLAYGSYDLFVPPKLDDRVDGEIQRGFREAIVNARLKARSLDQATVDALVNVPPVRSVTVTRENQRITVKGMNFLFPVAFGLLLFIGVMGGGGQLLTTMVEEKSSRVVEVLLSAVSPLELMAGKLLGQMAASLLGMCLYLAMGISLLSVFALLGLLNVSLVFYLILFFVITYLVMGSLMMAVGAAVNDMKEAQGLLAPLTILFIIPWILWMPISADPGSTLSVTMSFLPPVNTFAMLLRMASSVPPPLWQVWLSTAIGVGSVFCALWVAAKVFRIGLLMYGKPPNFATLIRWIRAA